VNAIRCQVVRYLCVPGHLNSKKLAVTVDP
jgi:hypothetical protein